MTRTLPDVTGTRATVNTPLEPGVYFWRLVGLAGAARGTVASPVWQFYVRGRTTGTDTSWGTDPDFDGDGRANVLVGADGSNVAHLYHRTLPPSDAGISTTLRGTRGSGFGHSVASAGDVNGDGFADLIVGTFDADLAFVYHGGPGGVGAMASAVVLPPRGDSQFGKSVASAGDFNCDGYADVIVGAPRQSAAYVYRGGPSGVVVAEPEATLTSESAMNFGFLVASVGDIDADGCGDVIVSANISMEAHVFYGRARGIPRSTRMVGDRGFGLPVAGAGDVNGDGYADVLVGRSNEDPRVFVYHGGAGGLTAAPSPMEGLVTPTLAVGARLSATGAGDFDGDGFADLVVGAPGSGALVFWGSSMGIQAAARPPAALREPDGASARGFGEVVVGGGRIYDARFEDVLVGVPQSDRVYIYRGASTVPMMITPADELNSPAAPENFGAAVAMVGFPRGADEFCEGRSVGVRAGGRAYTR